MDSILEVVVPTLKPLDSCTSFKIMSIIMVDLLRNISSSFRGLFKICSVLQKFSMSLSEDGVGALLF